MPQFEDLADAPIPEGATREASEAEPEHVDGRPSTIYEESEADLEPHVMEVWCAELQGERELLEAAPLEDLLHRTHTDGS
eukprot:6430800-Pyramimonas_sp.AAC.1